MDSVRQNVTYFFSNYVIYLFFNWEDYSLKSLLDSAGLTGVILLISFQNNVSYVSCHLGKSCIKISARLGWSHLDSTELTWAKYCLLILVVYSANSCIKSLLDSAGLIWIRMYSDRQNFIYLFCKLCSFTRKTHADLTQDEFYLSLCNNFYYSATWENYVSKSLHCIEKCEWLTE